MASDRILELLRRPVDADEYHEIRELWKTHSKAEDARDLPGLISTLTEDCVYEVMGTGASLYFDQEAPDTLWLGQRGDSRIIARDAALLSDDAARLAIVPVGHPMGYQDAFNAFVSDAYRGITGEHIPGLPTAADGLRAAVLTAAVLASAKNGRWVEVSSTAATTTPAVPHAESQSRP